MTACGGEGARCWGEGGGFAGKALLLLSAPPGRRPPTMSCSPQGHSHAKTYSFIFRTVLTAVGQTLTAVMGAGVLNLPYAMASLGWVAGPMLILLFSWVTLFTSHMLVECHVINGKRQRTYVDLVKGLFGRLGYLVIGWWVVVAGTGCLEVY